MKKSTRVGLLHEHASSIAANLRPAGFAENPTLILKEEGDQSTLKSQNEKSKVLIDRGTPLIPYVH